MNGLPDIGDPFDVAEFRTFRIPDEQNALILMRRAADKFTPLHLNLSMDDPRLHDWFELNRPLVERFIQAADQADGISGPELDGDWRYYPNASNSGAGMVISMTYIEGGRAQSGATWLAPGTAIEPSSACTSTCGGASG